MGVNMYAEGAYQVAVYAVHVCAKRVERADAQGPLVAVVNLCVGIRPLDSVLAAGDGGVNLQGGQADIGGQADGEVGRRTDRA